MFSIRFYSGLAAWIKIKMTGGAPILLPVRDYKCSTHHSVLPKMRTNLLSRTLEPNSFCPKMNMSKEVENRGVHDLIEPCMTVKKLIYGHSATQTLQFDKILMLQTYVYVSLEPSYEYLRPYLPYWSFFIYRELTFPSTMSFLG